MSLEITPTHPTADSYISLADADSYVENRTDTDKWDALSDDQKEQLLRMATRQIDSFRFHNDKIYPVAKDYRLEQALEFPRTPTPQRTGTVSSASNNYIIATGLINQINYPDDFWNAGAIVITSGTGAGQIRLISDFEASTGKVTVASNWDTNPDSTSNFRLIKKIPDDVKFATIEQAYYLARGGGKRSQLQAEGVTSYRIGDLSETYEGGISGGEVKLSNEANARLVRYISKIGRFK